MPDARGCLCTAPRHVIGTSRRALGFCRRARPVVRAGVSEYEARLAAVGSRAQTQSKIRPLGDTDMVIGTLACIIYCALQCHCLIGIAGAAIASRAQLRAPNRSENNSIVNSIVIIVWVVLHRLHILTLHTCA